MKAVKGNKVYTIDETQKEFYRENGYDISDNEGNIIENSINKSISYEEYKALKEENMKLKEEIKKISKGEI